MKKQQLLGGMKGIMETATVAAPMTATQPIEPQQEKTKYKAVCYSIPPEVADRIKEIAYWDRKKINAVVVEAFTEYADKWDGANKR